MDIRRLPWSALTLLGLSAALAPSRAPAATPPAPEAPLEVQEALDTTRATVRETALWLARGVDSWFGDRPFEQGGSVSDGVLSVGLLRRPPDGLKAQVRFNARFRLPNLQERAYLFVGRDDTREVIRDQPGSLTRRQRLQAESPDDNRFFAGLGIALRESTDLRVGFRGGIKPYLQLRWRRPVPLGPDRLAELRQTFFWTVDDHLGSTTAASVEQLLGPDLALRWLGSLTYTQDAARWEGATSVGAYRHFGAQRQLALEVLATAAQHTGVTFTDYGLRATWRQPLHHDWLLGELLLGHFWPRADASVAREPGWAVGGTLFLKF